MKIDDAAQGSGGEDGGKKAGSMGQYGRFSFFPSKNLGAAGDAGMVVTNDRNRADILASLRNHGMREKYYHPLVGGNFRLDALQAAVISVKLPHLDRWTAARRNNAKRYNRFFEETGLTQRGLVNTPRARASRHIYNQYVIRAQRRTDLCKHLRERESGHEIYYPAPLHLQECFSYLGYGEGDFPHSEKAAVETLALPIYPELTSMQQEYVVSAIEDFYAGS